MNIRKKEKFSDKVVALHQRIIELERSGTTFQRAAEEMRERNDRFKALLDRSLLCVYVHDFEGRFIDANKAALNLLGYGREEISSISLTSLLDESQLQKAMDTLAEILQTGVQKKLTEYKLRKKDGTFVWVETDASMLNKQGKPFAIQGIAHDITERKQAEEALREKEEQYRLHLDSVSDVIYSLDTEFRVTSVSPSAENLLGYQPEELIGRPFAELNVLAPEYYLQALSDTMRVLNGERIRAVEYEFMTKDGTRKVGEVSGAPLVKDGKVIAVVSVARDITERKQMEQELERHRDHLRELVVEQTSELQMANAQLQKEIAERRRAEDEVRKLNDELEQQVKERTAALEKAYNDLAELDKMKDNLLSSVSHELRTPLTSIRSFSEILIRYDDVSVETRKEFLGIINSESDRLTRLINDFLDLARIEKGKMVWHDDLSSIKEIISDVIKAQQHLLHDRALRLTIDLPQELPLVFADRDRIQQVVTNLLGNAIKFSFEGREIGITVEPFEGKRSGETTKWIKVGISDQGIGIEEKEFGIIFEKFRQGSSDTRGDRPKGTGLGLHICKEIITHYGGNIWVSSERDKGSTFFFTLPSANAPDASAKDGQPENPRANGSKGQFCVEEGSTPSATRGCR